MSNVPTELFDTINDLDAYVANTKSLIHCINNPDTLETTTPENLFSGLYCVEERLETIEGKMRNVWDGIKSMSAIDKP